MVSCFDFRFRNTSNTAAFLSSYHYADKAERRRRERHQCRIQAILKGSRTPHVERSSVVESATNKQAIGVGAYGIVLKGTFFTDGEQMAVALKRPKEGSSKNRKCSYA